MKRRNLSRWAAMWMEVGLNFDGDPNGDKKQEIRLLDVSRKPTPVGNDAAWTVRTSKQAPTMGRELWSRRDRGSISESGDHPLRVPGEL